MKKYFKIIILVLIILLLVFFNLRKYYTKKEFEEYEVDLTNLNLQINEKEDCVKEKVLYHEEDGLKYYISCLENITDNNGQDLKKLLDAKKVTFEEIFSTYTKDVLEYDDGGSELYNFDNITIIKCSTLDGNRDVIIGNKITSINEGYCSKYFNKSDNGQCSFTKTYLIKEKKNLSKEKTEVTLSQFQGETATVIINKYPAEYLKTGKYYEFIFDNYDEIIKDQTINEIFDNYYFRAYNETDKLGLEQIQEPVCMPVSRDLLKKAYLYLTKEEQETIEDYFLAVTDYVKRDIIVRNKEGETKTYKNTEAIIVRFTTNQPIQPNVKVVVLDFKTKEVLGIKLTM